MREDYLKEPEENHGLVKDLLYLHVCQALDTFLQFIVNKERQELRTSHSKRFKK